MATIIQQKPYHNVLPVGQDVIFSVSNFNIIAGFTGVKLIAEVHISDNMPPNLAIPNDIVGTFRTTPNNAGVGMFDFRPIIESFVKTDNIAREGSRYKLNLITSDSDVPLHLIDKYSGNLNTVRYMAIKFTTEYIDANGDLVLDNTQDNSDAYRLINGYLKYTDELDLIGKNFGYNLSAFNNNSGTKKFLTNSPTTQYANVDDYGTMGMLMLNPLTPTNTQGTIGVVFNYYDDSGAFIATETVNHSPSYGGFVYPDADIQALVLFFGVFPANLQNWSTIFNTNIANIAYYDFKITNTAGHGLSELYKININCPNTKGYQPIRLTWLNQWGTWDYYTFTMKSTKMISTKGSTYQQLEGSWNSSFYKLDSFRGGKKSFRVNATEKITMNTDFVNESDSEWFEELINSPEVYILEGFKTDPANSALNKYVTPVRLNTSSYTKKTIANDRLMQYTFEVEKTKTLRTQSI